MYRKNDQIQQSETHQHYRELVCENTEKDTKLTIKMRKGGIMVNNEVLKPAISPPSNADVLNLSQEELEAVKAIKIINGSEHVEKGSEFTSHVVKVKSTNEVLNAYQKMRIKNADASHIICAYWLDNPIGPYRQQVIDDHDYGLGRAALKVLKEKDVINSCAFIVRFYGSMALG